MSNSIVNNNSPAGHWRRFVEGGFFFYPLLMHWLIVRDMHAAALIGLTAVSLAACVLLWWESRAGFQSAVYAFMALAAVSALWMGRAWALYLPPVVFNLMFAVAFGRTLRSREQPIIERFMQLHHNDGIPPAIRRYARQLTWIWTIFFISMAAVACVLARYASMEAWSIFANVINYALILVLFAAQFVYGALRHRMPAVSEIVPIALKVARRAARGATVGR